MTPAPGEPPAGPWRVEPVAVLVDLLADAAGPVGDRPRVVAVDGRSGSGKSTLADQLQAAVPSSSVVHTDDVAWHHAFFDWADLLASGVLEPVRRGDAIAYRPPGWVAKGRPGAVTVAAGLDLVVVEGVGAGRRELADLVDAVVWVQADFAEAERRGIERDVAAGRSRAEATSFWHEWMAEELPFLARQRPWERADLVVAGSPSDIGSPVDIGGGPPPAPRPGRVALVSPVRRAAVEASDAPTPSG